MTGIKIQGVDRLVEKLGKVASVQTLRPPMGRALGDLKIAMSKYPQPRYGSSYVRTDRLKNSWTFANPSIRAGRGGLVGTIGTNVTYAPFVQSQWFQAWMHQGRWPTDQDVLDKAKPVIVGDFEKAIKKAIR